MAIHVARPNAASTNALRPTLIMLRSSLASSALVFVVPRTVLYFRRDPNRLVDLLQLFLLGNFVGFGELGIFRLRRTGVIARIETWSRYDFPQLAITGAAARRTLLVHSVARLIDGQARIAGVFVCWHFKISAFF